MKHAQIHNVADNNKWRHTWISMLCMTEFNKYKYTRCPKNLLTECCWSDYAPGLENIFCLFRWENLAPQHSHLVIIFSCLSSSLSTYLTGSLIHDSSFSLNDESWINDPVRYVGIELNFRAIDVAMRAHLSLTKMAFPHPQIGHFQCLKRKFKTTSQ